MLNGLLCFCKPNIFIKPLIPNGDILVYEVHYQGEGGQENGGVVNVTATFVELYQHC